LENVADNENDESPHYGVQKFPIASLVRVAERKIQVETHFAQVGS
jgi:hypothetical protein